MCSDLLPSILKPFHLLIEIFSISYDISYWCHCASVCDGISRLKKLRADCLKIQTAFACRFSNVYSQCKGLLTKDKVHQMSLSFLSGSRCISVQFRFWTVEFFYDSRNEKLCSVLTFFLSELNSIKMFYSALLVSDYSSVMFFLSSCSVAHRYMNSNKFSGFMWVVYSSYCTNNAYLISAPVFSNIRGPRTECYRGFFIFFSLDS